MPFTSFRFVLFAAIVVGLFNVVPARHRSTLLLLASLVFYAEASLVHLLVLVAVTVAAYVGARIVERQPSRSAVAAAVVVIVLPLVVFKYSGFVTQLTMQLLGREGTRAVDATLPLGISFFTFQAIAYIVDVYRHDQPAQRSLASVALYVAFFPKLLAGPIERARDLFPQLARLVPSTATNLYAGLKFVLWGFFSKLVVADNIGSIVDGVLRAPHQESGGTLLIAFALYAFQIYFDFLGYTNIAIGVARCFNIRLNPNFNRPYAATSLQDFWRRWHISLSTWFRDYVYIPLGGSTTTGGKRLGQVMTVFLVSGLWHGAAAHFAMWGAFHGAAYWIEDQLRKRVSPRWSVGKAASGSLRTTTQRLLTFGVVTMGWVFFRVSDLQIAGVVLRKIAAVDDIVPYSTLNGLLLRPDSLWFVVILTSAVVLDSSRAFRQSLEGLPQSPRRLIGDLAYVNWMTLTLVLLGDLGVRDFTYFRF